MFEDMKKVVSLKGDMNELWNIDLLTLKFKPHDIKERERKMACIKKEY